MSTILVVDDEYLIADILGMFLEDEGFEVVRAGDGEQALQALERTRVELVITDYMMPRLNGKDLAMKIRENEQLRHLPMILISGAQAHEGWESPDLFAAVFEKPFDIPKLIAAVNQLLRPPKSS
ncbi:MULTISPECIES: response regulator [Pseudomonas]|uniref:Response regulator n=1 Tax=Pseudomonas auratipiscis TaxID=3115853 RepID=A0AB35WYD4_9PSED|nr:MULTISPECIES: response regulator [unclassified Pseudomonas]MEE1869131.1 response regulator [Pseudomonas sp. 120P]MEE1959885.1 response regulator [Pseudomonas sp. 119P]